MTTFFQGLSRTFKALWPPCYYSQPITVHGLPLVGQQKMNKFVNGQHCWPTFWTHDRLLFGKHMLANICWSCVRGLIQCKVSQKCTIKNILCNKHWSLLTIKLHNIQRSACIQRTWYWQGWWIFWFPQVNPARTWTQMHASHCQQKSTTNIIIIAIESGVYQRIYALPKKSGTTEYGSHKTITLTSPTTKVNSESVTRCSAAWK